ncbi:MAG: VacB/RNase II family 3'-5' exoribonuclease, partial [Clostridia bacterium]|nr:VacB/RNase II family 3'-5' exoribonuclease [Clostridia bacterium]
CCGAVLGRLHIRREFPAEVLAEARQAAARTENFSGRLDLRGSVILTIDGADSKDLDDAISLEKRGEGWLLGVHIADVSHYVKAGSQLDAEALRRGTSIYYADSVIPMLPKELSNGICSLNPNEDRPAFTALMELDAQGAMQGCEIKKTVIRSRVKGVYSEINRIFDASADDALQEKYAQVAPSLKMMRALAHTLTLRRLARGAVDIDSDDCKITVDENGSVVTVERRSQGEAEIMIEEFMLCANESVATYASGLGMPLVYRVHDRPEAKKLDELAVVLRAAGIDTRDIRHDMQPQDFAKLLHKADATGKGAVLSGMVLRAMAKAHYSPDCTGHFGLALEKYCHFTSPIRRYPDLATHRILTDIVTQGPGDAIVKRYRSFTQDAAESSSQNEITAMQVERYCESIYKAEWMSRHLGESFEGLICSVRPFGFYVRLDNTVEGLCRPENVPGPCDYDERRMCFVGGGKTYALGDSLPVFVARADVATGQIDFSLIAPHPVTASPQRSERAPRPNKPHSAEHGHPKAHSRRRPGPHRKQAEHK